MDRNKTTGKILEPGTIFRVRTVTQRKEENGLSQTYLQLFDGSGWAFVEHPSSKDKRQLVLKVHITNEILVEISRMVSTTE